MKKVLAIFLALIIGLSMSAQIQNKFLGFTLGTTTKSEVSNKYKNEELYLETENDINVGYLTFAGQRWDVVTFQFYDNKLLSIQFYLTEPASSITLMDLVWDNLRDKLWNKYSEYYRDNSTSDFIMYFDDKTALSLSYRYTSGNKGLGLFYRDRALAKQQSQAEEDEL